MLKDQAAIESTKIAKRKKGVLRAKSEFFRAARYGLTLQEHRIIYYAILAGQQEGRPFEPVELTISDFKELFELEGHAYHQKLRILTQKLVGRSVEVQYKDEKGQHYKHIAWLSDITYHAKTGTVTITPNIKLKEFFEGKPFSSSEYYYLVQFTSQYAERLYELLKSLDHKTIIDFNIEDLAKRLFVPASYRQNYFNLKKFALEPAVKDINEFTDLDVDIREKRGRHNKVNTVIFSVTKKKPPEHVARVKHSDPQPPLSDEEQEDFIRKMMGGNFEVMDMTLAHTNDTN
jgi:plasmid replication initiation protein